MSALVGYGSSSDDEEVAEVVAKPAPTIELPAVLTDTPIEKARSDLTEVKTLQHNVPEVAVGGPLLGPAAPTNGGMMDADSPARVPENMSERDTIRHLTQPSIPMSSMPSSPPGSPDPAANTRFSRFLELKAKGVHFNQDLAGKSSFLNPRLLATMMARAEIEEEDQYNTSLSLDLWNPKGFPEWAYKEELLKRQQEVKDKDEAERKVLSAAGKRTIEFAPPGVNSGDSSRRTTPGYQKKRRRPLSPPI